MSDGRKGFRFCPVSNQAYYYKLRRMEVDHMDGDMTSSMGKHR